MDQILAADWRAVDWDAHTRSVTLIDGEQVSYVDVGAGPVVLLVHGLGGSWKVWLENIVALAGSRRVVAVDLPGFGASPVGTGSHTFVAYARTLDRLCAALGISSVVAIGNSFGGFVAAELAIRRPDLVAGLVLIDAAGMAPSRAELRKVVTLLRLAGWAAPLASRYRQAISRHPRVRRQAFGIIMARGDRLAGDLTFALLPERPSPIFAAVLRTGARSLSVAWCDRVSDIEAPALIVWGERDRQLPLRHAHEWARLLRRSTLAVVPGAGHMPMLECPEEVNGHVAMFLEALGSPTR